MNLLPLLLAVSLFFVACGLWIAYWDLHRVRTDKAGVPTAADGEPMMCDRVGFRISVACSLLLHAGIVGILLLVGDIAPGTRPFPGADPMATGDDFYVLLTSLPEEEIKSSDISPADSVRPSVQAATPALPTLTVTWGVLEARVEPPAPPHAIVVAHAPAGDSTNEDPPPKMVAKEVPTAAPAANDEASPRYATKRQRVVELFSVRALKPTAERLVPAAPLPSSVDSAQPEPPQTQSGAVLPASQPTHEAPPLPVPEGSAVASQPLDAGPSLFPPPGTVIAAQPATPSSSAKSAPPSLRQAESASPPIVAAARPSASEPPSPSQKTRASTTDTQDPVEEVAPLPPKSKVSASIAEVKRQPSPSSDATLQEPGDAQDDHSAATSPEFHAASESPLVPTSGGPAVAAESPEVDPALFPAPGTTVAARTIVPSSSVTSVVHRPSASEPTEVREGTQLASLRAPEDLPTSPDQASTPLPGRSSFADLSLQEPEEGPNARLGSASAVEEVVPDAAPMTAEDSPAVATEVLEDDPVRIAASIPPIPEPPAESQDTHSDETETLEAFPADGALQEPERVPFDHPVEEHPAAQAVSESPTVATASEPVVAEPFDAGPTLFPSPGTVVVARETTVSAPMDGATSGPSASEPTEERQETQLAELPGPEVLSTSPIEESTPRPPVPEVSPQDLEEKPDASTSADATPQEPERPPLTESMVASAAPEVVADPAPAAAFDGTAVAPELDEGAARIAAALPPKAEPPPGNQGTSSAEGETPEEVSVVNPTSEATRVPLLANVSPPTQHKKPLPSPSVDTTSLGPVESPGTRLEAASPTPDGAPDPPAVLDTDTTAVAIRSLDAGPGFFPPPGTAITVQTTPSSPRVASAPPPRPPAPDPKEIHQGTQVAALEASEPLPAEPGRSSSSGPSPRRSEETAIADSVAASLVPEGAPDSSSAPAPQAPVIAPGSLGANATLFPPPGAVVEPPLFASAESTPGLADGRGVGRLNVRLDGPRSRVTEQETETVSGKVRGGVPARVVLYVNDVAREIDAEGGSFQASVSLQRGPNRLRAVAEDWLGMAMEDAITIEYVPPPVPNGIAITSPQDGHTLPPDAPPIILVEGRVEDWTISTVWLVANDRRISVRAQNGRFRKALPLLDPLIRMWAEIPANGKPRRRSQGVTVRVPSRSLSYGLLMMSWPSTVTGDRIQVKATWRARPERLDVPVQRVPLKVVGASPKGTLPEAFYLRLKPGVYTFLLMARAALAGDVRATLYVPRANRLRAREISPISLNGTGQVVLTRVLLPQGVFWEQDEWFTGQSESAVTVTKFRFPEGISWTERKEGLR